MRAVVFILVVACVAGILFWNDLFKGGEEAAPPAEETIQVVDGAPEERPAAAESSQGSLHKQLMREGRWEDALQAIEALPGPPEDVQRLAEKHFCLVKLGRGEAADQVLGVLLKGDPTSPEAARAAVLSVEGGAHSHLEIRQRLSRVAGGFGALDEGSVELLIGAVRRINAALPGSIEGLIKTTSYTIKPGDSLWEICKKFNRDSRLNIEVGLVSLLNRLKREDLIHAGDLLKIPQEKVSIKIWRVNWLLTVFIGETLLCAYRVGLGTGGSTPAGDFVIKNRLKNPDWYSEQKGKIIHFGEKENILGTRWLGFENQPNARGLGIHGTVDNDSIGRNLSSGCIRLANEDVEALFDIIARETPVTIL